MSKPDWSAIERDYRSGDTSIRSLAERYGISDTAIRKKAKSEGWQQGEKVRTESSHQVCSANQNANQGKKPGRSSDYLPEIATDICSLLITGDSLRNICKRPGMPNKGTVMRWLKIHEEFRDQYAKAADIRADAIFEEMLDISDDVETDSAAVAKARLQIETRKWVVARMAPKKYSDRVDDKSIGQSDEKLLLEIERLRLANEKTKAEIDRLKNGDGENETVIIHNTLKIEGAQQNEGE